MGKYFEASSISEIYGQFFCAIIEETPALGGGVSIEQIELSLTTHTFLLITHQV